MQADKILKLVRLTEKSNKLSSTLGQYTFEVYGHANKHQIAEAVEQTFKVTVRRVNIQNYRGKNKRGRNGRPSTTSDFFAFCTCSTGFSLARADGTSFSLQQFDVGFGSSLSANMQVIGTKVDNSTVTYELSNYFPDQWFTASPQLLGFSNLKSVSFVGTGPISIALDNIVVTQVPVPAAAWLFGSALAGLGLQAGRRAKRA